MNENLKGQIVGALIGGGLGYIVGSVICDVWCPEYEEVEVYQVDDDSIGAARNAANAIDDKFDRAARNIRRTKPARKGDAGKVINYNLVGRSGSPAEDLAKLTEKYRKIEPGGVALLNDDSPVDGEDPLDTPDLTDPEAPFVISSDNYDNEEGFTALTLHYYILDDVMTDVLGRAVENVENVIGDDALTCFGLDSGDADIVYVRNPKLRGDYEIIRLHKSYSKDVLGIKQPPTKVRKQSDVDRDREDD